MASVYYAQGGYAEPSCSLNARLPSHYPGGISG
jgi:hypothetical protein